MESDSIFFKLLFESHILRIENIQILIHLVVFSGKARHIFLCGAFSLKQQLFFGRFQFLDFFCYGCKLLV